MILYITGGERSGKSNYAQQQALEKSSEPIYIATSRIWDEDFKNRVQKHVSGRDERWTTIEEEKHIGTLNLEQKVAVLDCVTLWLTNFYTDTNYNVQDSLEQAKKEFDLLAAQDCTLIIISNELGMGVHAETEIGRKFVELQGWMNQYIASKAHNAVLMVSGIPLRLK
jgi:adenosylcobinamide kinase/adenosylcobinamide-phosphate guanylyltransferase